MKDQQSCPKCCKTSAIFFGKYRLKDGRDIQRIRCLNPNCKKTSTVENPAFHRLRYPRNKIHLAITLYIKRNSLRKIAAIVGVKNPNTVIGWINRILNCPLGYRRYLEGLGMPKAHTTIFFSELRSALRNRLTRASRDEINTRVDKLEPIFRHLNQRDEHIQKHPTLRYKKYANYSGQ